VAIHHFLPLVNHQCSLVGLLRHNLHVNLHRHRPVNRRRSQLVNHLVNLH
jgi:hypothetical protein